MNPIVRRIIRILSVIAFIAIIGIIAFITWNAVSDKEAFKLWVDEHAVEGRLAYILIVTIQIMVAVIPGGPIEVVGGYTFGPIEGIILFIAGATLGSIFVFLLVRKFGQHLVEVFFKKHEIKKLQFLQEAKKRDPLFFALFLIPGAPKDLMCYVAGLTKMRFPVFVFICSVGRLPAVVGSAVSGYALDTNNFMVAVLAFSVTTVISGIGFVFYYMITERNRKKEES